jgi:hypothetical protein
MLALNHSLLNKEYTIINVLKALNSIISMCGLNAIFLSKITRRYFTLFTKSMFVHSMREENEVDLFDQRSR